MTVLLMSCKIAINKEEKYELHGEDLLLLLIFFFNQRLLRIIQAFQLARCTQELCLPWFNLSRFLHRIWLRSLQYVLEKLIPLGLLFSVVQWAFAFASDRPGFMFTCMTFSKLLFWASVSLSINIKYGYYETLPHRVQDEANSQMYSAPGIELAVSKWQVSAMNESSMYTATSLSTGGDRHWANPSKRSCLFLISYTRGQSTGCI